MATSSNIEKVSYDQNNKDEDNEPNKSLKMVSLM